MQYAKTWAALFGTVLSAIAGYLFVGHHSLSADEWSTVAASAAGALTVYAAPNTLSAPMTKFLSSLIMSALAWVTSLASSGVAGSNMWQLVIVVATSVLVYLVPNQVPVGPNPSSLAGLRKPRA